MKSEKEKKMFSFQRFSSFLSLDPSNLIILHGVKMVGKDFLYKRTKVEKNTEIQKSRIKGADS